MVRSDGKTGYGHNDNGDFGNNPVTVDFYYNAYSYPLTFYNYDGTLISTQEVTLGTDISSYLAGQIPDNPMEGATWKGWYTDPKHSDGTEYSGGNKMPAGLVLYGDFEFPTRTVTYDSQGGTSVNPETKEYGFYATIPANPTRAHYTFLGWFTAPDETGSSYDWNKAVTENITLYAHWEQRKAAEEYIDAVQEVFGITVSDTLTMDFAVLDSAGKPCQLDEDDEASITISNKDFNDTTSVWHFVDSVDEKEELKPEYVKADAVNGEVTFLTKSFSVFLLGEGHKIGAKKSRALRSVDYVQVRFDPTITSEEPQAPTEISVVRGNAIGGQLPDVPVVPGYPTRWVIQGSDPAVEVTENTIVEEPFTAFVEIGEMTFVRDRVQDQERIGTVGRI